MSTLDNRGVAVMYLSAERLAIADREVVETFGETSVAWQAIPHWDTGDPGQARVRNDVVNAPNVLPIGLQSDQFRATLAQLGAPTPDSLLAEVMSSAATLAAKVDDDVLDALRTNTFISANPVTIAAGLQPDKIMNALIDARARLEDAGYRAPSCLITNTEGLKKLNAFSSGYPVTDSILVAANINSVHRTSWLDNEPPADTDPDVPNTTPPLAPTNTIVMLLIGRRQRIAHGAAADASPGEEPVDLAVSVPPSLEVVGERADRDIEMAVRIRYATRIKNPQGVVLITP